MARIETEKLLIKLVDAELATRKARGEYAGKFAGLSHYFGYEGRCSLPSDFDATYAPPPHTHTHHRATTALDPGTAMRWAMVQQPSWSTTPLA